MTIRPLKVVRSLFLTADYLTIPQIEEIAKGVKRVVEDPVGVGFGAVTLVIERGKIVGVQVMTSQRLLNEMLE